MVNLHELARGHTALECDDPTRVGIYQAAGEYDAVVCSGLEYVTSDVPAEDVVAGVTTVVVRVTPAGTEEAAVVPSLRRSTFDFHSGQSRKRGRWRRPLDG